MAGGQPNDRGHNEDYLNLFADPVQHDDHYGFWSDTTIKCTRLFVQLNSFPVLQLYTISLLQQKCA